MSDYIPITKELREQLAVGAGTALGTGFRRGQVVRVGDLLDKCDIIDALHKSLEEQNAKLHEKVLNQRKQLAEVQEAIERRNNGVLKRRWQKKMDALKNENEEMRDFNCRVREAIRRHEDLTLWGTDYTELPLDADKVPTHIGDKMDGDDGEIVDVLGVSRYGIFYYSDTEQRIKCIHSTDLHHHHEPTVEDVLREFVTEFNRDDTELCDDEIIERFAKRLQLAEGDTE